MIICDYYRQFKDKKVVVGLGYFDSVHKGHTYLIEEVKRLASELNALPAIFTFSSNPFAELGMATKNIFSFEERARRLQHLDVEVVIGVDAKRDFFNMTGDEFLDIFTKNYNVVGFVSGTDYTYGKMASGDEYSLLEYGKAHNIRVSIVNLLSKSGRKIASRDIRELLLQGEIQKVNELLSEPYSLSGKVRQGRQDGSKIGFPTANIDLEEGNLIVRNGVYSSIAVVNGKRYKAVTNIGGHPTFGDNKKNAEAYIIDFEGDIYGEEITIIPVRWLRPVMLFSSVKELHDTIENDKNTTIREVIL